MAIEEESLAKGVENVKISEDTPVEQKQEETGANDAGSASATKKKKKNKKKKSSSAATNGDEEGGEKNENIKRNYFNFYLFKCESIQLIRFFVIYSLI